MNLDILTIQYNLVDKDSGIIYHVNYLSKSGNAFKVEIFKDYNITALAKVRTLFIPSVMSAVVLVEEATKDRSSNKTKYHY